MRIGKFLTRLTIMWNPFRRKSEAQKTLHQVTLTATILGNLERKGLIHWQVKENLLLIEESLAQVWLSYGERGFKNCLNAAAQWQNFRIIQAAYEDRRVELEAAAVRKAKEGNPDLALTDADITRIRQNARDNMPEADLETFNVMSEFDILVIRSTGAATAAATEDNGQLLAVGHFDGKILEMALYADIKHNFRKRGEKEK